MIKTIAVGFWICLVTLVSTWAGATYLAGGDTEQNAEEAKGGHGGHMAKLQEVRPRPVSVPVIANGAIQGYVMASTVFTIKKEMSDQLAIKPDAFIVDEVFRTFYDSEPIDFKNLKKTQVAEIAKRIKDKVNKRFGGDFVEDVLFEDLNYVPMDKTRGGSGKTNG